MAEKAYILKESAIKAYESASISVDRIRAIPAVDVVEVIRCKDCEYWIPDGKNIMVCTGAMAYCDTDGEWYCAFAKRRK